jgi:hypothetical protein
MLGKTIITEDSHFFKKGQIVEGELSKDGLLVENHFVSKDSFIILNEALSLQDEEKVKNLVRDIIKRMFYRQYVRAAFLLK